VRPAQRLWGVDRRAELVVLACVRAYVVAPHLLDDLYGLLETFEPLGQRREGYAERSVFLVPTRRRCRAWPAAGQHIQCRNDLGKQARVPVREAGDQQL
jgi:hypothetical protein